MKLPLLSLFKKKAPSNYYLSLLLSEEKVIAIVLQEIEGVLRVVGTNEHSLPAYLEQIPHEDLIEILDQTISHAEEMLPPNIETEKTIFGVKASWVDEKKIKKEHLSHLKKICEDLSLQPIGFMVISEAISLLLSKEEGAPLSAILAEIHSKDITLTLFRASKIVETHSGHIEGSIPQSVDRLLHHFTIDVLPSRIIILDGQHDDTLAQELLTHHWSKSIPFLHVPQISLLPSGFDGKAMIYGAGEQMNFSVNEALGDLKIQTVGSEDTASKPKPKDESNSEDTGHHSYQTPAGDITHEDPINNQDNFGFVTDQDIEKSTNHTRPSLTIKSGSKTTSHTTQEMQNITKSGDVLYLHSPEESLGNNERKGVVPAPLSILSALLNKHKLPNLPFISLPSVPKLFLILPAIIILLITLGAFYLATVRAIVTLQMEPKKIDDSMTVTLSANSENDLSQKILATQEIRTELEGTDSISTTGKKDIGDKAKGTITLYNNTDNKTTITSGTIISSSNDLAYITSDDVSIASASGDASSPKPGTASVKVVAKNIGSEYNLPSNTKFSIEGFTSSSLAGKNESAFSGGSKKSVTVVDKKDIDNLIEKLTKQLENKAKETLKDKAGAGQQILPVFTAATLSKKSFNADVGEEASKLTLKGTVTFTTLAYKTEDLGKIAQAAIQGKYNQDLSLSDKGIVTELQDIKPKKNGDATASLVMDAGLLPKIDKTSIVQQITGKSFLDATSYLQTLPQVSGAVIELSPSIPLIPKILPQVSQNIEIKIKTNE